MNNEIKGGGPPTDPAQEGGGGLIDNGSSQAGILRRLEKAANGGDEAQADNPSHQPTQSVKAQQNSETEQNPDEGLKTAGLQRDEGGYVLFIPEGELPSSQVESDIGIKKLADGVWEIRLPDGQKVILGISDIVPGILGRFSIPKIASGLNPDITLRLYELVEKAAPFLGISLPLKREGYGSGKLALDETKADAGREPPSARLEITEGKLSEGLERAIGENVKRDEQGVFTINCFNLKKPTELIIRPKVEIDCELFCQGNVILVIDHGQLSSKELGETVGRDITLLRAIPLTNEEGNEVYLQPELKLKGGVYGHINIQSGEAFLEDSAHVKKGITITGGVLTIDNSVVADLTGFEEAERFGLIADGDGVKVVVRDSIVNGIQVLDGAEVTVGGRSILTFSKDSMSPTFVQVGGDGQRSTLRLEPGNAKILPTVLANISLHPLGEIFFPPNMMDINYLMSSIYFYQLGEDRYELRIKDADQEGMISLGWEEVSKKTRIPNGFSIRDSRYGYEYVDRPNGGYYLIPRN